MDENLLSQVRWILERFKSVDSREEEGIDEVLKQLKELSSTLREAAGVIYDNLPDPEFEDELGEGVKIGDKLLSLSQNSDEPDPFKVG